MVKLPKHSDFEANLNGTFVIHFSDDLAIEAKLIEISSLRRVKSVESFSLIFLLPLDAPAYQDTFRIENEALGSFDLFLVPIGRPKEGVEYEAIFNLFVSES